MTVKFVSSVIFLWFGLAAVLAGCRRESEQVNQAPIPPPPDVGRITTFMSCKAVPRRILSSHEQCLIKALSSRCLPADDCLVQCLSSPGALRVRGGCEHVCYQALHVRPPDPPGMVGCLAKQ